MTVLIGVAFALTMSVQAQQKVSERTALASGDVDATTDILPIVDISAETAGSKKITVNDLFTGWGMTAAGKALCDDEAASNQRTTLGLGTAATLDYGTGLGNLVRLDASTGKLPAVDGSLLTGITFTGFTAAETTAAPNGTIYVDSLTAKGSSTHVDAVLKPKGASGSLLAAIPDSTATGGNKRGTAAIDWQLTRAAAAEVASGSYTVLSGGSGNTVSGDYAVVTGGRGNTASGAYSSINGGYGATTRGIYGAEAVAAGTFAAQGDAQEGHYFLRRATTDDTPTELLADGSTASSAYRITLPDNTTYSFHGQLVGRASDGTSVAWSIEGAIKRGSGAASTALVDSVSSTKKADAGAATWGFSATADTGNGSLKIEVTGAAATNIRWLAVVDTAEVGY